MIININLCDEDNERVAEVLFNELLKIGVERTTMCKEQTKFIVVDGKVCFE